ncbi:putative WD-40 repeat protein [Neospora caninum Liverpool]|uniref:Putative WD-40 repeat protein n=1 Tax=Neospora caninum (strain Liverpool) TaxID=572307 RepID=F0VAA1_NEOCL|nr:putative WD-40 repeat protein [Neospora caninum Liverpool]CBZ50590.1 putative WD-40 repeat protein [Neospora caninum Liverpool]CEL65203.1 TPA: WD-40 repeat protein, putative [Neospora caninum Liverpool]|eukprot:XP_003880623.1 putative WD-40 repeat protein [Neospora caninum Liverpool]
MSLRERQEEQLHQAVLLYLQKRFPETAKVFQDEAKLHGVAASASTNATRRTSVGGEGASRVRAAGGKLSASLDMDADLLPRRWAATARLQATVTSLQNQLTRQQDQIALLMAAAAGRSPEDTETKTAPSPPPGAGANGAVEKGAETAEDAKKGEGEDRGPASVGLPAGPAVYVLAGQRCPVNALAVHPLLAQLVTAADDGIVRVFHIMQREGKFERQFKAHSASVNAVAYDQSGRWFGSASSDMTVRIFDVQQNYEPYRTLQGHNDIVSALQFCSLASSRLGAEPVVPSYGGLPGSDAASSPAASLFVFSCSRDGAVKLWSLASGLCLRTFAPAPEESLLGAGGNKEAWIRDVAVPEDALKAAKVFASCGNDQKVCLWRYDLGLPVREMAGHSHVVESVVFASEKMLRLLHSHKQAPALLPGSILDEASLRESEKATGTGSVLRLCGLVLFSASRDRTLRMWDAMQGSTMRVFVGHDNWVRRIVLHPGGSHIISCSDDRSIRCWNILSGACERVLSSAHSQFVTCLGLDPTTQLLASGSLDCTVKLWSCNRAQQMELAEKELKGDGPA